MSKFIETKTVTKVEKYIPKSIHLENGAEVEIIEEGTCVDIIIDGYSFSALYLRELAAGLIEIADYLDEKEN